MKNFGPYKIWRRIEIILALIYFCFRVFFIDRFFPPGMFKKGYYSKGLIIRKIGKKKLRPLGWKLSNWIDYRQSGGNSIYAEFNNYKTGSKILVIHAFWWPEGAHHLNDEPYFAYQYIDRYGDKNFIPWSLDINKPNLYHHSTKEECINIVSVEFDSVVNFLKNYK